MIDLNVRAERMGWLPSAPQLATNPLTLAAEAEKAGVAVKDHVVAGLKSGSLADGLRGSGQSGQFSAQSVHLALEPVRLVRQGARIFPQAFPRHAHGLQGKDLGEMDGVKPRRGRLARSGAGGQARSRRHARLPHVDELSLFRHRAADRDLVREERPQHHRHAYLHPSAVGGGGSGLGIAKRLGDLQDHRQALLGTGDRPSRRRARRGAHPDPARHRRRTGAALRRQGLEEGRMRTHTGRYRPADRRWSSEIIPTPIGASRRSDRSSTSSAMEDKGIEWEARARGRRAARTELPR